MSNNTKSTIKTVAGGLAGLIAICAVVYGMYWIAKTVSYQIFYEDMVIEEIQEQVKSECLIK